MTQNEIRNIIIDKRNNGIDPSDDDIQVALQYFTREELECMRFPVIDHTRCFCSDKSDVLVTIVRPEEDFDYPQQ